jgi:small subunit ribosomal protein S6
MALYESVIIGRQDLTNSQFETLIDEFVTVIKTNEGEIKKTEYWGIRNLAYKINKNRKGHYYMLNIESPSATISEYERLLGLHEDIVRFLTIRIDKVDETPSPLMNNKVDRHRNESTDDNIKTASKANV